MPQVQRRLVHTRSIRFEAYQREDRLWDFVASVQDVKTRDFPLENGTRSAGDPFHDMRITVTIDATMTIVAVEAVTIAAPFMGACDTFSQVYQKLVGLNLLLRFRAAVRERVGGNQGCTHVSELAALLPTVAIQAFSGEMPRPDRGPDAMPLQLDRCHALRLDGPVVARLYPRWYINKD
jgi:hypothetical protein